MNFLNAFLRKSELSELLLHEVRRTKALKNGEVH